MQKSSIRIHALLPAILLLLCPMQAEARRHHGHGPHCRLGQLYRVSLGKCVGARSALGRELTPRPVSLRSTRRLSRVRQETRPEEANGDAPYYVNILLPHDGSLRHTRRVEDVDKERDKAPDKAPEKASDSDPDYNPLWPHGWDKWPPKPAEGDRLLHR